MIRKTAIPNSSKTSKVSCTLLSTPFTTVIFPGSPLCTHQSSHCVGSTITPLANGHAVSRLSDLIIYSVEAAQIALCVAEYGPSTKLGATVAGQTSVKAPEREAFEKFLPRDVDIVSVHSLHGPTVTTEGQPLVSLVRLFGKRNRQLTVRMGKIIIHHRGPTEKVRLVEDVFRTFKSRYVYLGYEEHDMVTANTQAVTHAAFLRWVKSKESMGFLA